MNSYRRSKKVIELVHRYHSQGVPKDKIMRLLAIPTHEIDKILKETAPDPDLPAAPNQETSLLERAEKEIDCQLKSFPEFISFSSKEKYILVPYANRFTKEDWFLIATAKTIFPGSKIRSFEKRD